MCWVRVPPHATRFTSQRQRAGDAVPWRDHWEVRHPGVGGAGRDGRGLRRLRSRAGSQGRGQAAAGQARQRRLTGRGTPAHAARGAGDRAAVAPERRRRLRRRHLPAIRCSSRWSSSRGTPSPTGSSRKPRSWQEVLKVFMAAGRGLAAAHDKGLVHRDFKPDNVMVGARRPGARHGLRPRAPGPREGIRVSPRRSSDPTPAPAVRPDAVPIAQAGEQATMVLNTVAGEASGPLEVAWRTSTCSRRRSRATGAMMGTPAYMAPEQFLGVGTDARTDQFSFCVALYEALYGQRPFGGNTLYALTNNVVQGRVREVPADARVPAWLRKVVLRGLRSNPAERYPSMAELIETLGKNPTVQRRRSRGGGAAVGGGVVARWASASSGARPSSRPCAAAGRRNWRTFGRSSRPPKGGFRGRSRFAARSCGRGRATRPTFSRRSAAR